MTAPAFLTTDADDEILADLAAVGVTLAPPAERAPAPLAAFASDLLRAMAEVDRETALLAETRAAEHARVDMRYSLPLDRLSKRRAVLEGALGAIARDFPYPKGKKSMQVGHGTFGVRTTPEKIAVLHDATVLAWAERAAPTLVKVVEKRSVPHAGLVAYYRETGELPDGCVHTPAVETPYAKPEGA